MEKETVTHGQIAEQRLRNQRLTRLGFRQPAEVVAWFGAVQAQEYEPAKWALGLRMKKRPLCTDVQRAFDEGSILRTHVMRPTWHFVSAADIRWLIELTGPRVQRVMSTYDRQLGLDSRMLVRGTKLIETALRDRSYLTRIEVGERLRRGGLPLDGVRLAHVAMYAELEGVICSGPRRGKQSTYALVAERVPDAIRLSRDEALATLARRYFSSHGPATIRDFVWWSGLATAEAKRALDMNAARREEADGRTYWTIGDRSSGATRNELVHLLPVYDEYIVAYRDREAVPHGPSTIRPGSRPGDSVTFQHTLVIGGHVAGTWRRVQKAKFAAIDIVPMRRLSRVERQAVGDAARRYEEFLCAPVTCSIR
jgi:hypothetical protein